MALAAAPWLAGFTIQAEVGRGGMAVVYRAWDPKLSRPVALKVLSSTLSQQPDFRRRFIHESRVIASLEHPGIVPIYSAGEADGALYIAMRLVEGWDLDSWLRRVGPINPDDALTLLAPVAAALDAAHDRGIIHRDVKPANILIHPATDGSREAYLTDFGLALARDEVSRLTGAGAFVGTLNYTSPEQIDGARMDGRTDIYALAAVLYECLVGTPPYPRENASAVLLAHLSAPPPRISEHRPELGPAIDAVIAAGLAKAPSGRPQSATALLTSARAALTVGAASVPPARTPKRPGSGHISLIAHPVPPVPRSDPAPQETDASAPSPGSRLRFVAAVVAIVAAAGTAGWVALTSPRATGARVPPPPAASHPATARPPAPQASPAFGSTAGVAVTDPLGYFTATFPTIPTRATSSTGGIPSEVYGATGPDGSIYTLRATTIPQGSPAVTASLEQTDLDGYAQSVAATVVASTPSTFQGHPAVLSAVRSGAWSAQSLQFTVGSRYYFLTVSGGPSASADLTRFAASLVIPS